MNRAWLIAATIAVALVGAGCSSSTAPIPNSSRSSPVPVENSSSQPMETVPATAVSSSVSHSTSATSSLTTTSAPSTSPATTTVSTTPTQTTVVGPPTCVIAAVHLTSMIGGAYQGREIAAVIVTNVSGKTCTLRGYLSVQLRYRGKPLGRPGAAPTGTPPTFTLKKGAAAQVQLTAVSTCQAPESDHGRVALPGAPTTVDIAVELRGCGLSVGAFESP